MTTSNITTAEFEEQIEEIMDEAIGEATDRPADQLQAIRVAMKGLLELAHRVVRGTEAEARAESYWMAHIAAAMSYESGYLGRSMVTMEHTIDELNNEDLDEEEE